MRYESDKLTRLLSEQNAALRLLRELAAIPLEQFAIDPHKVASAKYNFVVAIEATIDIVNHLIRKNGYRVPEDYADTFRVLTENGLFPYEFGERLANMARFRNRLVHLYWAVDVAQLHKILREELGDFNLFRQYLAKAIGE
ncbi:MAG: type VII toxin-antitoxin system HepT family RNase toxin [Bacillota bacterium]